jgi:hypothetical protein
MPCETCKTFPVPTFMFEELETNLERHGTLFRCKGCGTLFEMIEEERAVRFASIEELKKYYTKAREL